MKKTILPSLLLAATAACTPAYVDRDFLKAIEDTAEHCTVNRYFPDIERCKGGPGGKEKAVMELARLSAAGGYRNTLPTTAYFLNSADERVSMVSVFLLHRIYPAGIRNPGEDLEISKEVSDQLIGGFARFGKSGPKGNAHLGKFIVRSVAYAAVLAKNRKAFDAALDAYPDTATQEEGYAALMEMERLASFEKLRASAAGGDPVLAKRALAACVGMEDLSPEERAMICPWGKAFLSHAAPEVALEAGKLMVHCGGNYIDELIAEGHRREADGTLKAPFHRAFAALCPGRDTSTGSALQQARTVALMQRALANEKLDEKVRADALSYICYQEGPACAGLARRYAKHSNPVISGRAKEIIFSQPEGK